MLASPVGPRVRVMAKGDDVELALGVKVAVRRGSRDCIGVVTHLEGEYLTIYVTQAQWNEPLQLRVHRDDVRCLAGWV